ncbi:TadE family type IV pilus minor pilin [Microbacterium sp. YJN-G]|uniref:TadE family type IV pilus minor pilin n=1 Tax=Microbacterium sp. YJN-G TaxID=2763257 RepID=UPI0018778614|nr:TadE family type IV pilus minor pilin [Microbacterium sp. YJN-G]
MRRRPSPPDAAGERGSVAAELAVALPAVLLALMLGAGALSAAAQQVALQDAAADAARLLGRGESNDRAAGVVQRAVGGARLSAHRADGLVCAAASAEVQFGRLISIPLRAESCALEGGL